MLLGPTFMITLLGIFSIGVLTGVALGYGIAARFITSYYVGSVKGSKASNVRKLHNRK